MKKQGICNLTGVHGKYVKSHLIPRALTRLSSTGNAHIQVGIGLKETRRFDSWYDDALVTQSGEDVLTAIDTKAILELRRHRLVWSGWGDDRELTTKDFMEPANGKVRQITGIDSGVLRLFFLSLLWRCAASTRTEFSEIVLAPEQLIDLRKRIIGGAPGPAKEYPVQLFQIVTRGIIHNRTPLLERKHIITADGSLGEEVPYVRLYMDGLVVHVHLGDSENINSDYLNTCLGSSERTIVFAHDFEDSRTKLDMDEMAAIVHAEQYRPSTPKHAISAAVSAVFGAPQNPNDLPAERD